MSCLSREFVVGLAGVLWSSFLSLAIASPRAPTAGAASARFYYWLAARPCYPPLPYVCVVLYVRLSWLVAVLMPCTAARMIATLFSVFARSPPVHGALQKPSGTSPTVQVPDEGYSISNISTR